MVIVTTVYEEGDRGDEDVCFFPCYRCDMCDFSVLCVFLVLLCGFGFLCAFLCFCS